MSLDDTHKALIAFHKRMQGFNEQLAASHRELKRQHDAVAPHWKDAASRQYHTIYDPLEVHLEKYISHSSQQFEEVMRKKIAELDRYLKGGM